MTTTSRKTKIFHLFWLVPVRVTFSWRWGLHLPRFTFSVGGE